MLESQFRITFEKASRAKGITGENLLGMLERRLDNVVFRMGLAASRSQARQIVRHRHINVNGRKMNIPSGLVKQGDEISVREGSKNNTTILSSRDASHAPSPGWMDVDRENPEGPYQLCSAARRVNPDSDQRTVNRRTLQQVKQVWLE